MKRIKKLIIRDDRMWGLAKLAHMLFSAQAEHETFKKDATVIMIEMKRALEKAWAERDAALKKLARRKTK